MAQQISLDSLVSDLARLNSGPGAAYDAATNETASLVSQIAEANYQMGQQNLVSTLAAKEAEVAREADAQSKMLGMIKKLGLDPNDDTSQFSQLAATLDRKQQQLQMSMLEMEKLRGVSLADNPIQWLVNQVQLDQKGAQFEQYSREADVAAKLMHERAAAGSEAAQVIISGKQVTSQVERDAALQNVAFASQIKLNQQLVQDKLTGAAALKDTFNSGMDRIRAATQIYTLQADAAEKSRQRILDSVNLETARLRLSEAKIDIKRKDAYEALVRQTGEKLFGRKIDARIPVEVLAADPAISASLIPMAATRGNALGFGAYTTYQNVMKAGGSLLEPSWRKTLRDYLSTETVAAEAAVIKSFTDKQKIPPKKPEELAVLADKEMMKKVQEAAAGDLDSFAPHALAPIGFYGNQRVLNKTALWKGTLSKLPAETKLTASSLTSYAAEEVAKGTMSAGQAAVELAAFMAVHQNIINGAVDPMLFGLPLMKRALVPVTTPGTGLFGSGAVTRRVDLLNAGEAELAINAKITEAKRRAADISYTESLAIPMFGTK